MAQAMLDMDEYASSIVFGETDSEEDSEFEGFDEDDLNINAISLRLNASENNQERIREQFEKYKCAREQIASFHDEEIPHLEIVTDSNDCEEINSEAHRVKVPCVSDSTRCNLRIKRLSKDNEFVPRGNGKLALDESQNFNSYLNKCKNVIQGDSYQDSFFTEKELRVNLIRLESHPTEKSRKEYIVSSKERKLKPKQGFLKHRQATKAHYQLRNCQKRSFSCTTLSKSPFNWKMSKLEAIK